MAADSNERELLAAQLVIDNCANLMRGATVTLYMDNMNAVSVLTKGSAKIRLQQYAGHVADVLVRHNVRLKPLWIPRDLNNLADAISCTMDYDDYSVTVDFYRLAQKESGVRTTVDTFANGKNAKESRFYSPTFVTGCIGVDAFNYVWSPTETHWIFPPINLVGRAIQHLKKSGCLGLVLVPQWKASYFYPLLRECMETGIAKKVRVFKGEGIFILGSDPTSYFGPEFCGNVETWLLDCRH